MSKPDALAASAASPRPWRLGPGKHGATTILGANGRTVALCQSVSWDAPTAEARANAELIVRAVNGGGEGPGEGDK